MLLAPGDVVVDVGAGLGLFGIYCESLFEAMPALRLLAIQTDDNDNNDDDNNDNSDRNDASDKVFEALELNLRRFNCESVCQRCASPCCMGDVLSLVGRQWPLQPIALLRLDIGNQLREFLDLSHELEWAGVRKVMVRCTASELDHARIRLGQIGFEDVQHVALDDVGIVLASKS